MRSEPDFRPTHRSGHPAIKMFQASRRNRRAKFLRRVIARIATLAFVLAELPRAFAAAPPTLPNIAESQPVEAAPFSARPDNVALLLKPLRHDEASVSPRRAKNRAAALPDIGGHLDAHGIENSIPKPVFAARDRAGADADRALGTLPRPYDALGPP